MGLAYDLFGTGRTALKVSLGRYSTQLITAASNPARNVAASATRTWDDNTFPVGDPRRGNYVPDCVLGTSVPGANGECGAMSDLNFRDRKFSVRATRLTRSTGFNRQDRNWQGSPSRCSMNCGQGSGWEPRSVSERGMAGLFVTDHPSSRPDIL